LADGLEVGLLEFPELSMRVKLSNNPAF